VATRAVAEDAFGLMHAAYLFMYQPGTFAKKKKKKKKAIK